MGMRLDHVVIVVSDLAAATRDYTALGFTVTPGGTHADGTTHNTLIAFADGAYIELLAFLDLDRSRDHPWRHRLDEGEGIEDFALLSSDLTADAARIQTATVGVSLNLAPIADGGRRRPDGQELRWRTLRAIQQTGDTALPFVIQDVTPRDLRVPSGDTTHHRLPVSGIAGVTVAVRDLPDQVARFAALLGLDNPPATAPDATQARIALGDQWIDLVTSVAPVAGAAERLHRHGEGPFAMTLRPTLAHAPHDTTPLDISLAHGAIILAPMREA